MQIMTPTDISVRYVEYPWSDEFPLAYFNQTPGSDNSNKLHFHDAMEIGLCRQGRGLFFTNNQVISFAKDDMIVAMSGQPHVIVSSTEDQSNWQFLLFDTNRMFHEIGLAEYKPISDILFEKQMVPNFFKSGTNNELSNLAKLVFSELDKKLPGYQHMVKALLWAYLLSVSRLSESATSDWNMFNESGNNFASLVPAINHVMTNFNQEITISQLADLCYLSVRHFTRLFRKTMGCSAIDYISKVRIRMSSALLKSTDLSIANISMEVGYNTISSFNRHFSKIKGVSPREYRDKYR